MEKTKADLRKRNDELVREVNVLNCANQKLIKLNEKLFKHLKDVVLWTTNHNQYEIWPRNDVYHAALDLVEKIEIEQEGKTKQDG